MNKISPNWPMLNWIVVEIFIFILTDVRWLNLNSGRASYWEEENSKFPFGYCVEIFYSLMDWMNDWKPLSEIVARKLTILVEGFFFNVIYFNVLKIYNICIIDSSDSNALTFSQVFLIYYNFLNSKILFDGKSIWI